MVTIKVNGTDNSVSHKGAMHFAKNTAPDVCKTPSPGGPVPIPYPVIMSLSSDLASGTTTVKADGGNMIAIKGSEYSRCSGDEAGTAGGVVSSANMKEATWILYSFDVKMDGGNACRKTDKMKMNHGNTFCMGGNDGPTIKAGIRALKKIMCDCAKAEEKKKSKPKNYSCRDDFGNNVQDCCEKAIEDHNKKDPPEPPKLQGEQGYNPNGTRSSRKSQRMGPTESTAEYFSSISGKRFPDAAVLDDSTPPKVTQFCDFKAKCPKGMRTSRSNPSPTSGTADTGWRPGRFLKGGKNRGKWKPGQFEEIQRLGRQQKPPVTRDPVLIKNVNCPK